MVPPGEHDTVLVRFSIYLTSSGTIGSSSADISLSLETKTAMAPTHSSMDWMMRTTVVWLLPVKHDTVTADLAGKKEYMITRKCWARMDRYHATFMFNSSH